MRALAALAPAHRDPIARRQQDALDPQHLLPGDGEHFRLTTQQAANLLNVSRQYLVRLLDAKRIPHTKTGKHRRLKIEDVLAFKRERDASREAALDELTELSQELGGYDELT